MNEINNTVSYIEKIKKSYLKILKRLPDDEGLNHYLSLLESNEIDENQLEEILKNSDEAAGYVKNPKVTSNEKWNDKMKTPFIVAMYRVKNEERWIEKSLKYTSEVCKEIVILDDGSTDDTMKICKKFSKVVDIFHQEDMQLDETRDRNFLLKMALKRKPEFILLLDGDSILMQDQRDIIFEDIVLRYPNYTTFASQSFVMWDEPNQYRCDGVYDKRWKKKIIRIQKDGSRLYFPETQYPGNTHGPGICGVSIPVRTRIKILHYGHYDKELRMRKFQYYNKIDPNNSDFECYRGIISAGTKDTGKDVKVKTLPEGKYISEIV